MPPTSDLTEVLAALRRFFDSLGTRWILFGAQAVVAYGRPRLTADVDVTAELDPAAAAELISRLSEAGFTTQVEDPAAFVERTRTLPLSHEATGLPVDLVFAGPGLETEFLSNARLLRIGGIDVPVISPEDLLVTKILAGRRKDLEDAEGVLRARSEELHLGRTRRLLGLIEQALDRRDLLPELERMLSRTTAD